MKLEIQLKQNFSELKKYIKYHESYKKVKYLGKTTKINESPDNFKLDSVKNPHSDRNYAIRFVSQSLPICPITSQPDFAKIIIDYVPNKLIMESKSFKLFLVTSETASHEDCTIKIAKKLKRDQA